MLVKLKTLSSMLLFFIGIERAMQNAAGINTNTAYVISGGVPLLVGFLDPCSICMQLSILKSQLIGKGR